MVSEKRIVSTAALVSCRAELMPSGSSSACRSHPISSAKASTSSIATYPRIACTATLPRGGHGPQRVANSSSPV
jgi:hypothetical protein